VTKVAIAQVSPAQVRSLQIGRTQIGLSKSYARQMGLAQVGST
jgi:hypothetical protein